MNNIVNISNTRFSLNGVEYLKNYVSSIAGNKLELYNCYERKDVLVCLTHYSGFLVNGVSYSSAAALQQALLGVTYLRSTLAEGSFFDQNNIGRIINAGAIANTGSGFSMKAAVAARLNAFGFAVSAKETPVIVLAQLRTGSYLTEKHRYLFKSGRGTYGLSGTPVTAGALELISVENYTVDDVEEDANAVKNQLTNVLNGNFVSKANLSQWDFSDSGIPTGNGVKSYYFKYAADGVTRFALFTGMPGIYGDGATPLTESHFEGIAKSDTKAAVVPPLQEVAKSGNEVADIPLALKESSIAKLELKGQGINYTDEASGLGTKVRFADPVTDTIAVFPAKVSDYTLASTGDIDALSLAASQAAAEIYLKNAAGDTIATLNVGFLNNEGTTFVYNAATEKLELRNDTGILLSEIPVSAFVSNMVHSAVFSGTTLRFRDAEGNTVFSVTPGIENISGLQADLDARQTWKKALKLVNAGTPGYSAGAYTLQPGDEYRWLCFDLASGFNIIVPGGFPAGTLFEGETIGAGQAAFTAGSGITLHYGASENPRTAEPNSVFGLRFRDTAHVTLFGKLEIA